MHAAQVFGRDRRSLAALVMAVPLLLAACSSGTPSAAPASAPPSTAAAPSTAPESVAPASPDAGKTLELAYISFAVANSYDAPMLAAARAAAAAGNANLTVFDGNLNPQTQTQQLQDAIASGKYDGIILQPVYGPALVPGAEQAIAAGIHIGNIDQILGADNTTADSQVEGQLTNVVFVPSELGRKIGEMVVEACADANPCNVGYIWSVKAAALDQELKKAFDEATSVNPNIKVVAEGESFYTTRPASRPPRTCWRPTPISPSSRAQTRRSQVPSRPSRTPASLTRSSSSAMAAGPSRSRASPRASATAR